VVCGNQLLQLLDHRVKLVHAGRPLGEGGNVNPKLGGLALGARAGLALLIERILQLGDLLPAEVQGRLRLLCAFSRALDLVR